MNRMKHRLIAALAAVVASTTTTPGAAADEWHVGGVPLTGTAKVEGLNSLSVTIPIVPGITVATACDVHVTAEIWNSAGTGAGQVATFRPTMLTCAIYGMPFCRLTYFENDAPWDISVIADTRVQFDSVDLRMVFVNDGGTCAIAGGHQVTGSVAGRWHNGASELYFDNEYGLTTTGARPAIISGSIYLEEEGTAAAVTLQP